MPGYRLENLTRRLGATAALDGVSFEARSGALVVVLGPTGAGKTTLLRAIAGLEPLDAGRVVATDAAGAEVEVTDLPPAARDMAMVFQNFSLYPRLTVHDNLAFGLRPRWRKMARTEIQRRVQWAAEILGITDKLAQKPTELSGGQQQRVAIGRAIVREPQLFLLDEPLASLDTKLRETMTVEIHRLQRRLNVTMLYVTHDQTEAMGLADVIVVLDQGRVLQIGPPEEIYARPTSPRVARMLGSPPINLLTAAQARALGLAPAAPTVGIRPEHVRLARDEAGTATVRVVEHLGATATVTLRVMPADGAAFDVRTIAAPAEALAPGQRCRVEAAPERVLAWA